MVVLLVRGSRIGQNIAWLPANAFMSDLGGVPDRQL